MAGSLSSSQGMHGLGETLLERRRGWGSRRGSPEGSGGRRRGGGGSQEVKAVLSSGSSSGDVVFWGNSGVSSDGGTPWHGPMAKLSVRSAQGKELRGLAEARGHFVGGKRGWGRLGEGGYLLVPSQGTMAPSLSAARGREGQCSRSWE
jgi:hypothetical protein